MTSLFDYAAAQALRDEGLRTAAINSGGYYERALRILPTLRGEIGETFQGEQIRAALINRIGEPPSHKIWGAITRAAIKLEIIQGTGMYRATKSPKTHCHPTQIYRWGG